MSGSNGSPDRAHLEAQIVAFKAKAYDAIAQKEQAERTLRALNARVVELQMMLDRMPASPETTTTSETPVTSATAE